MRVGQALRVLRLVRPGERAAQAINARPQRQVALPIQFGELRFERRETPRPRMLVRRGQQLGARRDQEFLQLRVEMLSLLEAQPHACVEFAEASVHRGKLRLVVPPA